MTFPHNDDYNPFEPERPVDPTPLPMPLWNFEPDRISLQKLWKQIEKICARYHWQITLSFARSSYTAKMTADTSNWLYAEVRHTNQQKTIYLAVTQALKAQGKIDHEQPSREQEASNPEAGKE